MRIRFLHTEGFRLSAIYAGVFAVSVLVLGGFMLLTTDQAFRNQISEFSAADIAAIRNGYASEGLPEAAEVIVQLMSNPAKSDFYLLQRDGVRLAGNLPPMPPAAGTVQLPPRPGLHGDVLGEGAMLAPGVYVFSGSDLARIHALHNRILRVLLWLFAAALLLAGLGGALVSRSFLRRADAITLACRAIMHGDLKARIPVRGTQDELDRLAGAINEMLGRIVALMENLRQVTNDVAHDLRTPVTHLRHRLERARAEAATPEAYRRALDAAIASADEILALFAALLRIAQIESGARRAGFSTVDLGGLLRGLREIYGPVAEDEGHALAADLPDGLVIRGDRELLVQLFSNLIENAIVHTPSGTRIMLAAVRVRDQAVIAVRDDGPGVPREEHDRIFQRFYRREASRGRPGYGLGLSLASAICELHGGLIAIREQTPPGLAGLHVEVRFALERQTAGHSL